ncbi:hypothetical protein [Halococcus sp. PRR34]|uniref:hypothetical protein n=1 Tax=Halococcus sp. PRR34 TaxID=3020830 RepID=UPI00235FC822|nr:hypothetical protein [Halococcus sp. PRR34]
MSQSPEIDQMDEITLNYALSAVQAGVNKKEDALEKGATEEEAYTQGANQARGIVHSSGADVDDVVEHLLDRHGLIEFLLEDLLTDEEYAELVEE